MGEKHTTMQWSTDRVSDIWLERDGAKIRVAYGDLMGGVKSAQELEELIDFNVRACKAHDALVEYFRASEYLQMTLGHPEATAEDERKAEERYAASSKAARAALSKDGAA